LQFRYTINYYEDYLLKKPLIFLLFSWYFISCQTLNSVPRKSATFLPIFHLFDCCNRTRVRGRKSWTPTLWRPQFSKWQ
jgi:hypothetical protein